MIPGGWELVAILAVLVLLFGASKLPSSARAIGQSMRIFKAETKGMQSDDSGQHGNGDAKREQAAQQSTTQEPQALPPSEQRAPSTPAQQPQQDNTETR